MGRTEIDGKLRRIRLPLISRPVRLQTDPDDKRRQIVVPAGDTEVHSELSGTGFGSRLEAVFDPAGGERWRVARPVAEPVRAAP